MSDNTVLIIAVLVFSLMLVGLILTYLEFKHGAPKQQDEGEEEVRESPHNNH